MALEDLTWAQEAQHILLALPKMEDGLVLTDATGRILWVNASYEQLCGYSINELRGRKPGELLQGRESDPATVEQMRTAIREARPCTAEIINYHKDGHPYRISIRFSPVFDAAGKLTRFFAIERKVTTTSQSERLLSDSAFGFRRDRMCNVAYNDLIPVCAWCKSVRDTEGRWYPIETFLWHAIQKHCTSSICPSCVVTFETEMNQP